MLEFMGLWTLGRVYGFMVLGHALGSGLETFHAAAFFLSAPCALSPYTLPSLYPHPVHTPCALSPPPLHTPCAFFPRTLRPLSRV